MTDLAGALIFSSAFIGITFGLMTASVILEIIYKIYNTTADALQELKFLLTRKK